MGARFEKNPRIDSDVQLLMGRFRDLIPDGRVIFHDEIERLLKLNRRSSRYLTVTKKWRDVVFNENHVFLDGRAAQGGGFRVLTPEEMVRYAHKGVRQVGRKLRSLIMVGSLPDPSELSVDAKLFQARLIVAMEQITSTHKRVLIDLSKAMRPPTPLPRAG